MTSLVAGTDVLIDLLANAPTSDTLTLVRLVMDLNFHYIVTNTLSDSDSIVDVGVGVTSKEGFDAGAASVPDPQDQTAYPPRGWIYVNSLYVGQALTADTGVWNNHGIIKADIGAMRKVDKGILFMRVANTNLNVGGAMEVTGRVRALCLT